ncbi:MAG: hypothetical protein M1830_000732 [Pleopsidium flavum]|nr:MAG: hypothetical protein M1830_000732 [Pleopsidium flavum]
MPRARSPYEKPWHQHITIDLLLRVANTTFLHPFVAWMIPLCLRARALPFTSLSFKISIAYAVLLTILYFLSNLNKRISHGRPRAVDLSEEVIVITGGASGLGLLIAEVYGMRGASVAVLDVREMENQEARGVEYYRCDVGDRAQVVRVAKQIEQDVRLFFNGSDCLGLLMLLYLKLGTPTILINNAGIVNGKPILSLTPEDIDCNFRVNLLSHFHTIQTFLRGMIHSRNGGTIVTVSSVLARLGCANLSDYTAAKAGLLALHASLSAELAEYPDIKTLLVTPGQLSTPLFEGVKSPSNFLGPVLEPVDVAKEIIAAIDAGVGGELAMPLYARWVNVLGVLPAGLQKTLRWASGVDKAMEGFRGQAGAGAREWESEKAGVR